jgi:hypothetical protein
MAYIYCIETLSRAQVTNKHMHISIYHNIQEMDIALSQVTNTHSHTLTLPSLQYLTLNNVGLITGFQVITTSSTHTHITINITRSTVHWRQNIGD